MPIPITCPKCAASNRAADAAAGTTIACTRCSWPIDVPGLGGAAATGIETAPKPQPRRKRDWGDEDEERRSIAKTKQRGGAGTMFLIVGGVLTLSCVVCMGGGAVIGWIYMARQQQVVVAERRAAIQAQQAAIAEQNALAGKGVKDAKDGPMAPLPPGGGAPKFEMPKDGGAFAPVAPGKGKIILNQQGRLMPNDPVRDGRPHKAITVRLEAGRTYVLDLQSAEMDSYLNLYDPAGNRVAQDDDSGGFPNARIRHTAMQTGDYTIGATVFGAVAPVGANFTLTVRED